MLLKAICELSDVDLVECSRYDIGHANWKVGRIGHRAGHSEKHLYYCERNAYKSALQPKIAARNPSIALPQIEKYPQITQGGRKKEGEFEFNKDAGMYVCKAGHMAIRKARQGKKGVGQNQADTYYLDVEKCKRCPLREGCYKDGAKSKSYSVTIKSDEHTEQMGSKRASTSRKRQSNATRLKPRTASSSVR